MLKKPSKPQQKLRQISAGIGTGFFKGEVRGNFIGWSKFQAGYLMILLCLTVVVQKPLYHSVILNVCTSKFKITVLES